MKNPFRSFAAAARLAPGDRGVARFLSRCRDCIKNPPPAEWTGTTVMSGK